MQQRSFECNLYLLRQKIQRQTIKRLCLSEMRSRFYTKHHLKFGKNQADNLAYIGFRRRFFPVFYWCLVLSSMMKMITDGTVNTAVTGAAAIMPFVLPADISKVTVQDKSVKMKVLTLF